LLVGGAAGTVGRVGRGDWLVGIGAANDTTSMELLPATRYVRRGDLNIAYQAFGAGPRSVVAVPALPSHLDLLWTEPAYARQMRRFASLRRNIVFDPPGLGDERGDAASADALDGLGPWR
jgi:hypothetical protein